MKYLPTACLWLVAMLGTSSHLSCVAAETVASESSSLREPKLTESDRDHWAWLPLKRPALPQIRQQGWPQNGVDYFILSRLEERGMQPALLADKATLLRRLKFDLHGLPPSVDELQQFEADQAPGAYERLVDRLLAAPAYGERWAQHWLDLARFAETDGFEHDKLRPHAWKYRDWVIEALNRDLPYDQFTRLQLTGDETGDPRDQVATMFCLAGPDMPDINEQDQRRHDKLNEITSTVGAVFLAMQLHCAQCHDHKYDPISQADFYRLRAVFESAIPLMKRDAPVYTLATQADPQPARFFARGELSHAGPVVEPAVPRVAVPEGSSIYCDSHSPRPAFANWLFEPSNPLTARVLANRIWQHHFGRSLCENPSDFGVVNGEPSHAELLDWLATEVQRAGWSLKHLHRVILTSATYRQAGVPSRFGDRPVAESVSAVRDHYGCFPRKRLEGETIRDALLFVCGQLNRQIGGPSVRPPLPDELVGTLLKGQWDASPAVEDHVRRSIYVFARRNLRYPLFDAFDRPDAGASCARRDRSTTAIQCLDMLNGDLTIAAARALRDNRLAWNERHADATDPEMIQQLYLQTLGRQPRFDEVLAIQSVLQAGCDDPSQDAWLTVCLALLNTNEFIYVD
jgi:hypothetical protein